MTQTLWTEEALRRIIREEIEAAILVARFRRAVEDLVKETERLGRCRRESRPWPFWRRLLGH